MFMKRGSIVEKRRLDKLQEMQLDIGKRQGLMLARDRA